MKAKEEHDRTLSNCEAMSQLIEAMRQRVKKDIASINEDELTENQWSRMIILRGETE